jgi:hypothetical protein
MSIFFQASLTFAAISFAASTRSTVSTTAWVCGSISINGRRAVRVQPRARTPPARAECRGRGRRRRRRSGFSGFTDLCRHLFRRQHAFDRIDNRLGLRVDLDIDAAKEMAAKVSEA